MLTKATTALQVPIANRLFVERENYPMTIIYMKLKYCGYSYGIFERILKDNQYVGETNDPAARLFAQYHVPQTKQMKKSILSEIKKSDSRIRVYEVGGLLNEILN